MLQQQENHTSFIMNLRLMSRASIVIIALIIFTFFLKETSQISITIFTGILLGLVFFPLIEILRDKLRFPIAIAILVSIFFFLVMSLVFFLLLYNSLSSITNDFSFYREKLYIMFDGIFTRLSYLKVDPNLLAQIEENIFNFLRNFAVSLSKGTFNFGKNYILIILTMIFTILERLGIYEKIKYIFFHENKNESGKKVETMLGEITHTISRFIALKALISACTGIIVYITFVIMGVNSPFLWGLLTFLFNFIPSVGSLIISIVSILFSILQFYPLWTPVIIIAIVILVIQNIIGNIIDPAILGDKLNLSPFVILIGLVYWGYVWGIMGMLLTVPLLVSIRIILQHIPYLKKVSMLLGNGFLMARESKRRKIN